MSDPNLNNLNCLYVARCLIPLTRTIRGAHLNAWRTSVEIQMALNIEIGPWRQLLILVLGLPLRCLTFLFCFSSLSAGETLPGATLVCMETHSQIHDIHYKWGIRFGTRVIEQKFLCVTIFPSIHTRTQFRCQLYSGGASDHGRNMLGFMPPGHMCRWFVSSELFIDLF